MHPPLLLLCFFTPVFFSLSDPSLAEVDAYDLNLITEPDASPLLLTSHNALDKEATLELELTATNYTILVSLRVGKNDHIVDTKAALDTGSDLIWLNSEECKEGPCKKQVPKRIKKPEAAPGDVCHKLECKAAEEIPTKPQPTCDKDENICPYRVEYRDGSSSEGEFTKDTFWFHDVITNEPEKSPTTLWLGVSNKATGNIDPESGGVVGLGPGKISLISQLIQREGLEKKFSYCLPPPSSSDGGPRAHGQLKFGNHLHMSKDNNIPLLNPTSCNNHYCVQLEKIVHEVSGDAKLVIDSGTTFTFLSEELLNDFKAMVMPQLKDKQSTKQCLLDGKFIYQDCFKIDRCEDVENVKASFGLKDGTKLELEYYNFIDCVEIDRVEIDPEHYACLTVKEGSDNILGSRAQIGFEVTFDLTDNDKLKVSFDRNGCSKPRVAATHCNPN